MNNISIRPRTPDDDQRLTEIRNAINHDRPPSTVEETRHYMASDPPEAARETYVVERNGEIVARIALSRITYVKQPGAHWADIAVDPTHWRQGIGRSAYDFMLRRVRERSATRLYGSFREDLPDAEAFLQRRGFTRTGHGDRISRLDVRTANLEKSCRAAERVRESGIRIRTLAEIDPDEAFLRTLHAMDNETARDIPSTEEWNEMPFDSWRANMLEAPGASPDILWIAFDGDRPIGLAGLHRRTGPNADNAYTAVDRAYRGRGIARALKYQTVEWARRNGIDYIYTGNDVENAPMLAINVDLGYQFLPRNVEMVREL